MSYRLWERSRIAWSCGWQDTGKTLDRKDAGYEEKSFTDYLVLPEGTVPVDADAMAHRVTQVTVPDGGFLAVIFKEKLNPHAFQRIQERFNEVAHAKEWSFTVVVLEGGAELVGVGPEKEVA